MDEEGVLWQDSSASSAGSLTIEDAEKMGINFNTDHRPVVGK